MSKLIFMAAIVISFTASKAWSACADTGAVTSITSGCTSVIDLQVNELVIVQGLVDINLGTYTGSDLSDGDDFCIGTNDTAGVTVNFESQNEGATNNFQLAGGGDFIEYDVTFTDGGSTVTPVVSDSAGAITTDDINIAAANTRALDCTTGGGDARIDVSVTAANINAASPGTYQDIITVTVAPQ